MSAYTAPASAQIAGVGTSPSSTKVLTAQLGGGQLLDLLLLGDEARATTDPAMAAPEAFSRLTAIRASTATDTVETSSAAITPPADLAALVETVTDQVGVAQTLAGSTVGAPSCRRS